MARLFLGGDVMTGRGIDQILPSPCDPALDESWRNVRDARQFIAAAEKRNGPVPRPVGPEYIWGDAMPLLAQAEARIVNLETAVTTSNDRFPKRISFRMNPANIGCLTAAKIDCAALANNHTLDWGAAGLAETIDSLKKAGIAASGAGETREEAEYPATCMAGGARVLLFSFGLPDSGIPQSWAAQEARPGVAFLPGLTREAAAHVAARIAAAKKPRDVAVVSLHWGRNFVYQVSPAQRGFARALIDAGADIVHGHSSHHPKGIEVYRGRPIFYGCGGVIDDYEGVKPEAEAFRPDLMLLNFAQVDSETGALQGLAMRAMRLRRMRLEHASRDDTLWLAKVMARECAKLGTRIGLRKDGTLILGWKEE
jgi:poly-gamma-glutamate synthesis protein (capsule biosynthesis protein)